MSAALAATSIGNTMPSPKSIAAPNNTETGASQTANKQVNNPTSAPKQVKQEGGEDNKPANAPLAPPPKPSQSQANQQSQQGNGNDYFNSGHNTSHFLNEPNPFEQSFGQPPSSNGTPNKFGGLPSVQSLASPAPLGPDGTPGWQNSLRSGPLSPAMLTGPQNSNGDYFDSSFRQSYPTPQESSLRSTGLTPGSSMFPAPSPNSQAIFNSIQGGGATPGTIDFQRTAARAAQNKGESGQSHQLAQQGQNMQGINKQDYQPAQQQQPMAQNPFNNNSEHDAVNSLYMLANNGQRNPNQFSMQNQPQGINTNVPQQMQNHGGAQDTSPSYQRGQNASAGNMSASTGTGMSENGDYGSEDGLDSKPSGRGRSRKQGNKGNTTSNGGRRKAEDTPAKGQASKKQKGNNGQSLDMDMPEDSDDDNQPIKNEQGQEIGKDGKKLTDEEKRKNFLERNRVAALKCRQRKKQWLANLQAKVEIFTTENDALTTQCGQLREENQNLKALLYQHKDCPVSHQQGLGGSRMAQVLGAEFETGPQQGGGPGYGAMGMGGQQGQPGMMGQGMHGGQGMQG